VRTLQRRIALEQQTFSGLLEQTRAEMAGDLLERPDRSVSEIAHDLGFTQQANFTRAFRRWAGGSPSQFRQQRLPASV
jgi:AraC-like DNA-binding protein